jgi:hypothetical protein
MKNLKVKLLEARKEILATKVVKKGRNKFSGYDYFKPSQITALVTKACVNNGLLTVFKITKSEDNYIGILELLDTESDDKLSFQIPTAMPEIKATNIAQKLGGMATYTQRYLEMIAFGITDDNLDLDNNKEVDNRPVLTLKHENFEKIKIGLKDKKFTLELIKKKYIVSDEIEKSLKLD